LNLDDLITRGRLTQIAPDAPAAARLLADAKRHLRSAQTLGEADRNGAYQLAYDGARKAVAAHMTAKGFRVRSGEGAHAVTAQYAEAMIDDPAVEFFDRMRRNRNRTEYGAVSVGIGQLQADMSRAADIVAAVERALSSQA
jgi:YD repeat-containing protein